MPPLGVANYISELWFEVGLCKQGFSGAIPIDWIDVKSYSDFRDLDYFEAKAIVMMSKEYCLGMSMTKPEDNAPYKREFTADEWIAREKTMEMEFDSFDRELKTAK